MDILQIMNKIHSNELFQQELALAYQLSFPFLMTANETAVATLVYTADFFDETALENVGYLVCGLQPEAKAHLVLQEITPTAIEKTPLSWVHRKHIEVHSKEEFIALQTSLYQALETITPWVYKEKGALGQVQILAVKTYLELLCALTNDTLLAYYYGANPDFFDWCCVVLYEK